jgi:hypothetical protein
MRKPQKKFQSKRWFNAVRDSLDDFGEESMENLSNVVLNAVENYAQAAEDAQPHLTAFGELSTKYAETPGLSAFYSAIHVDAQQVRKWLELVHEQRFNHIYQWLRSSPDAKAEYGELKTATDLNNFAKADPVYNKLGDLIRIVANAQHQIEVAVNTLTQRSITLNKLAEMKIAGLDEVWIDPPNIPDKKAS